MEVLDDCTDCMRSMAGASDWALAAQVKGFTGQESLQAAVKGAQLVTFPAGEPKFARLVHSNIAILTSHAI